SPGSAAPAAFGGAAALGLVIVAPGGEEPLRPVVLLTVTVVHLVHVLAGTAALLPRSALLHLSALARPLRRFLAIQAGVMALAGLAALLPGGRNPVLLEVLAVLGVAGAAVLAVVLLRRR
ncbi:MAG TPA: hypothetical protein VGD67_22590, partial [Pseudonocardiaceae bacterium]